MTDEYSLIEHKHRFAAWAASRAARVQRFPLKVCDGRAFLDQLGLREYVEHPDKLPGADDVDAVHPRVTPLHPPIDRLLLDELARKDVGG